VRRAAGLAVARACDVQGHVDATAIAATPDPGEGATLAPGRRNRMVPAVAAITCPVVRRRGLL